MDDLTGVRAQLVADMQRLTCRAMVGDHVVQVDSAISAAMRAVETALELERQRFPELTREAEVVARIAGYLYGTGTGTFLNECIADAMRLVSMAANAVKAERDVE